jgi:hypothetical protein
MKIQLHQFSVSNSIAIYTNATEISLYFSKSKSTYTHSLPPEPTLNLNYGDEVTTKRIPETANIYARHENDNKANIVALKVAAILDENRVALLSCISLSDLLNVYELKLKEHSLNQADFLSYYHLLVSCVSNLYLDEKTVFDGNHCNSYCVAALDAVSGKASKIHFYYSPIEGVKNLLLSLDLDALPSAIGAAHSLIADLHEQANENARLYEKATAELTASQKEAKEICDKDEELVGKVETRETQLFMQFALLLNEKKKKIRELMSKTDKPEGDVISEGAGDSSGEDDIDVDVLN